MDPRIIKEIQRLTTEIKNENNLNEKVIRDDVFNVLQKMPNCKVLYYPLDEEADEDGCDGCHVVRTIKGIKNQLVFINTANTRERQAFSVAHELGHIWNVDVRIKHTLPDIDFDVEDVINRFAAELLMPEKVFIEQANNKLYEVIKRETDSEGEKATILDIIKVIVYLMNYFFVPYKSVVIRLNEVGIINDLSKERLLEYKDSSYVETIIQERQYNRLGIKTGVMSIENLADRLDEIEERELFSVNRINAIRQKFDLKEVKDDAGMRDVLNINVPQGE